MYLWRAQHGSFRVPFLFAQKIDKLNSFTQLNSIEQLFADNNLKEVEELGISFGPRFSEICVHFGAQDCLDFLIREGNDLSPLLNLYRIVRDESIFPFISHPDELYYALIYERHEILPSATLTSETRLKRPSVYIAMLTLVRFLDEHRFDMVDYTSIIYPLYTQQEWSECVSQCTSKTISKLIAHKLFYFFDGSRLGHKATQAIENATQKERKEVSACCSLPITYLLGGRRKKGPCYRKVMKKFIEEPVQSSVDTNSVLAILIDGARTDFNF